MLVHILNNNKIYYDVLVMLFSYSTVEGSFSQYFNKIYILLLLYFQMHSYYSMVFVVSF